MKKVKKQSSVVEVFKVIAEIGALMKKLDVVSRRRLLDILNDRYW